MSRTKQARRAGKAKRVVVVGGGPGGLAAAMLLASRGFDVTVLEKEPETGGRSGAIRLGGYTFDTGSTLLMMRFLLDELFELTGRRTRDELDLVRLDPMYRLDFGGRALDVYADPKRMKAELARFEPGSEAGLDRFLRGEHRRLERLYPVLQKSWSGLGAMLSPAVAAAAPNVGLFRSLHQTAGDYFASDELRLGFSFQSAYLGMSPWNCPGGFAMVPYVEHGWGIDHVRGGLNRICAALRKVAEEEGARVRTGAEARRLLHEGGRCLGVELANGERLEADDVVVNADATRALTTLLDRDVSTRFSRRRLGKLRESCSTYMLYLGLDTELPLRHHTFFFARDYRAEMSRIFERGETGDDLSLYLCNPAASDDSMAPRGHSALYVLALVPNTRAPLDWAQPGGLAATMRERVLDAIERRAGIDVRPHIRAERMTTPGDWERRFNVSHGAVFGPAHTIGQLLAFRPPNRLPGLSNVCLAGGGTSPGSGLPTILESGRIAARLVCERHELPFPASKPLPAPEYLPAPDGAHKEMPWGVQAS